MQTLRKAIDYSHRSEAFTLYHLTDLHIGARACNERLIQQYIDRIASDENAYFTLGGDNMDAVCHVGDKRYDPATLAQWLLGEKDIFAAQVDRLLKLFAPIAHKCLAILYGNHEYAGLKFYGYDTYRHFVRGMAHAAKIEPDTLALGIGGFLCLSFRRHSAAVHPSTALVTAYLHHGWGGGALAGGHALKLERVLASYQCDLALLGHLHTNQLVTKTVIAPGKPAVIKHRYGLLLPSFLDAYVEPGKGTFPVDTYAEQKGLTPRPLGTVPIRITPNERQIELLHSGTF